MAFNPFDKPLDQLELADLDLLLSRKVAEGLFVEFKSQFPDNLKTASSVAAFGNTYGGWFIVGVETDSHNVATAIPGFDPQTTHDPTAKFRDAVRGNTSPTPLFLTRVFTLPTGRLVFVAHIPDTQDTPFITSNGRIYRRVADSKEPLAETDRHALDRLVQRGEKAETDWREFCQETRSDPDSEQQCGWISLFLSPHPRGAVFLPELYSKGYLEQALARSKVSPSVSADVPFGVRTTFGSAQYTYRSVILKANSSADVLREGATLELFVNGAARISLPVYPGESTHFFERMGAGAPNESLPVKALFQAWEELQGEAKFGMKLFDLSEPIISLGGLLDNYRELLKEHARGLEVRMGFTVENAHDFVAFVDDETWVDSVRQSGLPVFQQGSARVFHGELAVVKIDDPLEVLKAVASILALVFGLHEHVGRMALAAAIRKHGQQKRVNQG